MPKLNNMPQIPFDTDTLKMIGRCLEGMPKFKPYFDIVHIQAELVKAHEKRNRVNRDYAGIYIRYVLKGTKTPEGRASSIIGLDSKNMKGKVQAFIEAIADKAFDEYIKAGGANRTFGIAPPGGN